MSISEVLAGTRSLPRRKVPSVCSGSKHAHAWVVGYARCCTVPDFADRHNPLPYGGSWEWVCCRDCGFALQVQHDDLAAFKWRRCRDCFAPFPMTRGHAPKVLCDRCRRANDVNAVKLWNKRNAEKVKEYKRTFNERRKAQQGDAA